MGNDPLAWMRLLCLVMVGVNLALWKRRGVRAGVLAAAFLVFSFVIYAVQYRMNSIWLFAGVALTTLLLLVDAVLRTVERQNRR